jgi:hypothetical protein
MWPTDQIKEGVLDRQWPILPGDKLLPFAGACKFLSIALVKFHPVPVRGTVCRNSMETSVSRDEVSIEFLQTVPRTGTG